MPSKRRTSGRSYRLVWKLKDGAQQIYRSEVTYPILMRIRQLTSDEPWRGVAKSRLRGIWRRLMVVLGVPWDAVRDIPPREAVRQYQATRKSIEYLRVEMREVGPWVQMLDPLTNLLSPNSPSQDARVERLYEWVEGMTPEELDAWRYVAWKKLEARR